MYFKRKAYQLLLGFFCCISLAAAGQDQRVADSLAKIYKTDTLTGEVRLELLRNLAFNETNNNKLALKYADQLISLSKKEGNDIYLFHGYFQKGNSKRLDGNLAEAIDAYFKSAEIGKKLHKNQFEGSAYSTIADIYSVSNNHTNAMVYYYKAIAVLGDSHDTLALASAISNAGDEFVTRKMYDSALVYFKRSSTVFDQANYTTGKAYSLGNIGMVYAHTGQNAIAEKNIDEAIKLLEASGDYYPICVYLISMSDIYVEKGDQQTALNYAQRSLQLAQRYGLKEQISDADLKLSALYEKAGDMAASLQYYKNYVLYRDSVNNIKSVQQMADLRTNYEVSQKQVEVDLLNQQKRNQRNIMLSLFIILGLTIIILGTLYWYFRNISKEKKISESLLLNILPAETAKELKQNGKVASIKFDEVTVLFTDFVQFSKIAEHVDPEHLVRSIDFYFKGFDEITTKYGLEKIKTVGDAYMCAGGLPTVNITHEEDVIRAAKEIIAFVQTALITDDGLTHFAVRVGIHTGPVVAGIVGIKKWQYDIWGDTVNIASRMESASVPGRVNLSENTYEKIKDAFPCEYRGEIEVKNRGLLKMYFLK